jgi:CRISPR-associated protein Csh1
VYYSDNKENERSEIYNKIAFYERQSDYISLNKQQKFDKQQKIHSASPFSVAFNFSLGSKKKQIKTELEKQNNNSDEPIEILCKRYKIEKVLESIDSYFDNAKKLCDIQTLEIENELLDSFKNLVSKTLKNNLNKINDQFSFEDILSKLKTKDYVRFYLSSVSNNKWEKAYTNYYNKEIPPVEDNQNNFNTIFLNTSYPDKKPFLKHQTASFSENFKITNQTNKKLETFRKLTEIKPSILPNPLPLFVYKDELKRLFSIFQESNYKINYKQIVKKMFNHHKDDFHNYYLLYWQKGLSKIIIFDFDFVSKFEFKLDPEKCRVRNLFGLKEKGKNQLKTYTLENVFDFESVVFKQLLQNKYLILDYFGELKKDNYNGLDLSFSTFSKYRKAVYDYVYKSKRQAIGFTAFKEMVFARLKDNLKQDKEYAIKEILNIWFSLAEFFINPKNPKITMPSKLKSYREFVEKIISDEETKEKVSNEEFAFTAGQVVKYIHSKSKSANTGFGLLEPYTQQSRCDQFKLRIANDFERYKHENFSREFQRAASFVLSFETETDLKKLLPEMLAGFFDDNKLFSNSKNED